MLPLLTKQPEGTRPPHRAAAPSTGETTRQKLEKQQVLVSQEGFGQMSSSVAKLYLGPGPVVMVTVGQVQLGSSDPLPESPKWLLLVTPAPSHPGLGLPLNSEPHPDCSGS